MSSSATWSNRSPRAGRSRSSARCFPRSIGGGLYGYDAAGYWIDIGTPERYLEATWDLLAGRVHSTLPPRDETGSLIYANCLVAGAHVGPQSVLGRHCSVGTDARVERSVLHERVHVGADAAVIESVLAERVRVGERARVGPDAMVGANAVIEADAVGRSGRSRGAGRHRLGRLGGLMNLDNDSIEGVDRAGMLGEVLAQPLQLGDALWRAESAGIRPRDLPGGLVVCGMGGSAIGGDLALAALGDRATRPITVVRGYALESWIPPESLVLCASYSGDTEETLACFEAAGAAGTQRVVLTTGGALAELARAEGVPVIGVPAGMQPRAAVDLHDDRGAGVCGAVRRGACGARRGRYGHGVAGKTRRRVGSGCC